MNPGTFILQSEVKQDQGKTAAYVKVMEVETGGERAGGVPDVSLAHVVVFGRPGDCSCGK
jgi:hypothetical protein